MVERSNTNHFHYVCTKKKSYCLIICTLWARPSQTHDLIFFYISRRLIIKLIRNKSPFLWYSFTFNVVITHEIITFQDVCIDEIPKYFTSIKDTNYAALIWSDMNYALFNIQLAYIHVSVIVYIVCVYLWHNCCCFRRHRGTIVSANRVTFFE